MSTKMTLVYNNSEDENDFHLYEECFQVDGVYLQLNNWDFLQVDKGSVTVRIPIEVFKKIGREDLAKRVSDRAEQRKEEMKDCRWELNIE
jgi:hypothetical protein